MQPKPTLPGLRHSRYSGEAVKVPPKLLLLLCLVPVEPPRSPPLSGVSQNADAALRHTRYDSVVPTTLASGLVNLPHPVQLQLATTTNSCARLQLPNNRPRQLIA